MLAFGAGDSGSNPDRTTNPNIHTMKILTKLSIFIDAYLISYSK